MSLQVSHSEQELHEALPIALSATLLIFTAWGFSDQEIEWVLGISSEQLERYHQHPPTGTEASEELILRVAHVLGIQNALETIYQDRRDIFYWFHRRNDHAFFSGRTPKQHILTGGMDSLSEIRMYIQGF